MKLDFSKHLEAQDMIWIIEIGNCETRDARSHS